MPASLETRVTEYDVFISFAAADRDFAEEKLLAPLRAINVRCHSEDAFELGQYRLAEFEHAVRSSRYTLLVLSPDYIADGFGRLVDFLANTQGLERAANHVIPLIIRPVELPTHLRALVRLDASDPEGWQEVFRRLCEHLGRPVMSAPLKRRYLGERLNGRAKAFAFCLLAATPLMLLIAIMSRSQLQRLNRANEPPVRAGRLGDDEVTIHLPILAAMRDGNWEQAELLARERLGRYPDSSRLHYNLACALTRQAELLPADSAAKKFAAAKTHFQTALDQGILDVLLVYEKITKPIDFVKSDDDLIVLFDTYPQLKYYVDGYISRFMPVTGTATYMKGHTVTD